MEEVQQKVETLPLEVQQLLLQDVQDQRVIVAEVALLKSQLENVGGGLGEVVKREVLGHVGGVLDHLQAALGELSSKVEALQAQPQPRATLDEGFLRQVILEGISELTSDLQRKAEALEGGVVQKCQELERHTLEV